MKNLFSGNKQIPSSLYSKRSIKTIKNKLLALFILPLLFCMISNYAEAQCSGWPSPQFASTSITNNCPSTSVELPNYSNNNPGPAMLTWHTGPVASQANQILNTFSVGAGTYYAAFNDFGPSMCYTSTTPVTVTIQTPCCPAGNQAPQWSSSTNWCPSSGILYSYHTGNSPLSNDVIVTFHSGTPATNANRVMPTLVGNYLEVPAGPTYYVAFYDSVNNCYSGGNVGDGSATTMITTTLTNCPCSAGSASPSLSSTTLNNFNNCPDTNSNLNSITASNTPPGTSLTWHTASPAHSTNKLSPSATSSVPDGIYYAAFFDPLNNCYSGTTSGTGVTPVTVSTVACPSCYAPTTAPVGLVDTVWSVCPENLPYVFLEVLPNSSTPNYIRTWHTGPIPTLANRITSDIYILPFSPPAPNAYRAPGGTYYAADFDPVNVCFSPTHKLTFIVVPPATCCPSVGSAPPTLSTNSISSGCYSSSVDLTTITASNVPTGTSLTWNTYSHATTPTKITGTTITTSGTYYAAFYDALNDCYGNSSPVTVTIDSCTAPPPTSPTQCTNNSAPLNGNGPLVSNKFATSYSSSFFCGANTGPSMLVGQSYFDPFTSMSFPQNGRFTVNFPNPTGLIELEIYNLDNSSFGGSEYVEIWLNDTLIDLSAFPGVTLTQGVPGCPSTNSDSIGITTTSNLGYPNKAGVLFVPVMDYQGKGVLTIDLAAYGFGASKLEVKNIHAQGDGGGTRVKTSWCNDTLAYPARLSIPCPTMGAAAPLLSSATSAVNCTSSTADLSSITASNTPANGIVTFHSALPVSTANQIVANAVSQGNYFAAFYDTLTMCYGVATSSIAVTNNCPCATAGSNAPLLSASTATNTCPSSTVDLTSVTASNLPAGTSLTWHTATPATNANKIMGTAVSVGTYYAAFYDATNDCYSGTGGSATTSLTATINSCCAAGVTAPALSANTATNVCPATTTDLTTITASNLPASTTLTWHTATPATNANKVTGTAVSAGTYYAAFYDSTLDCYSGTAGSATSAVTVTQSNCCAAGSVAPTVN